MACKITKSNCGCYVRLGVSVFGGRNAHRVWTCVRARSIIITTTVIVCLSFVRWSIVRRYWTTWLSACTNWPASARDAWKGSLTQVFSPVTLQPLRRTYYVFDSPRQSNALENNTYSRLHVKWNQSFSNLANGVMPLRVNNTIYQRNYAMLYAH